MDRKPDSSKGADVLAISFATTLLMWIVFYGAAIPPGQITVWIVAVAVVVGGVLLTAAGYVAGVFAGRGVWGGTSVGVAVTALNLLILLSLIGGGTPQEEMGRIAVWLAGFMITAVGLSAVGAMLGRRSFRAGRKTANWTTRFAWVTAATVLLMLVAGGLVTGFEAGLAVEGWPGSEGHLVVLFPLELMRRDLETFVEHAHRLWGLLVGLATIMLMAHLWIVERRRWICWLATALVGAVIVQGTLGGTRVTEDSTALAIIHGIFGHVVLAVLVVIAAATGRSWSGDYAITSGRVLRTDAILGWWLGAVVLGQITLGTLFRHLQPLPETPSGLLMGVLHGHSFVGSALVVLMVLFCGLRAWGRYVDQPVFRRVGIAMVHTVFLQVLLGFGSFMVVPRGPRDPDDAITLLEVILTTAHQAIGAVLLALCALFVAWGMRLQKR